MQLEAVHHKAGLSEAFFLEVLPIAALRCHHLSQHWTSEWVEQKRGEGGRALPASAAVGPQPGKRRLAEGPWPVRSLDVQSAPLASPESRRWAWDVVCVTLPPSPPARGIAAAAAAVRGKREGRPLGVPRSTVVTDWVK